MRCRTDVDTPRMASWFKLAGQGHVVPKQAVAGHFNPHNPGQHRARVDTYPQLGGEVSKKYIIMYDDFDTLITIKQLQTIEQK